MKKLVIIFFSLFIFSCSQTGNIEPVEKKKENISVSKKEMFSSPAWGGNTGNLENDSFRN